MLVNFGYFCGNYQQWRQLAAEGFGPRDLRLVQQMFEPKRRPKSNDGPDAVVAWLGMDAGYKQNREMITACTGQRIRQYWSADGRVGLWIHFTGWSEGENEEMRPDGCGDDEGIHGGVWDSEPLAAVEAEVEAGGTDQRGRIEGSNGRLNAEAPIQEPRQSHP
ncbi:hypothetical protein E4U43_003546 [Claviceps pusilla]|uniref:Uncharacterized protein n=1 Tax=Claviceps pusilla TaxID=123648 RepID=A0A9P7NFI3_9HYPO|nr:hypothetical protein E4U43_003546 [Claviceps pusilla]